MMIEKSKLMVWGWMRRERERERERVCMYVCVCVWSEACIGSSKRKISQDDIKSKEY